MAADDIAPLKTRSSAILPVNGLAFTPAPPTVYVLMPLVPADPEATADADELT